MAAAVVLCAGPYFGRCFGQGAAPAADSLLQVTEAGESAAALALIDAKADVNARQDDGTTALHWAAYHDDLPLIRLLLKAGAKANVANDYGSTPLAEAAERADPEALRLLLEARWTYLQTNCSVSMKPKRSAAKKK